MNCYVETLPSNKIDINYINVVCCADNAVLIADSEDNTQRLLYTFVTTADE